MEYGSATASGSMSESSVSLVPKHPENIRKDRNTATNDLFDMCLHGCLDHEPNVRQCRTARFGDPSFQDFANPQLNLQSLH